jgi:hypothetical protein
VVVLVVLAASTVTAEIGAHRRVRQLSARH